MQSPIEIGSKDAQEQKMRKKQKNSILLMGVLFLASAFWGYRFALASPYDALAVLQDVLQGFSFAKKFSLWELFVFIFLNNAVKALLVLLLGFFFGIVPIFFIFTNGQLVGLLLGIAQLNGEGTLALLGLLPHGIFEIPALVISAGYGLWLGGCFFRLIVHKEPFSPQLKFALKKYWQVVVPLLLVAAVIETIVTPLVIILFR